MSKVKILYSYLRHLALGAYLTAFGLTNGNLVGILHMNSHEWKIVANSVWVAIIPQLRHAFVPILAKLTRYRVVEKVLVAVLVKKYPAYAGVFTAIASGVGVTVETVAPVGPAVTVQEDTSTITQPTGVTITQPTGVTTQPIGVTIQPTGVTTQPTGVTVNTTTGQPTN